MAGAEPEMKAALILLAAGGSRRYGRENKLLAAVDGKPMYRHILDRLISLRDGENAVFVVTNTPQIQAFCDANEVPWSANPDWAEGISSSIRVGVQQAPAAHAYVFFVADQPKLEGDTIRGFLTACRRADAELGCVAAEGRWGNPAWFGRNFVPDLSALEGDTGGKQILRKNAQKVLVFPVKRQELEDIDTPSLDIGETIPYNETSEKFKI